MNYYGTPVQAGLFDWGLFYRADHGIIPAAMGHNRNSGDLVDNSSVHSCVNLPLRRFAHIWTV